MSDNKKMQELTEQLTATFNDFGFKNVKLSEISFSYSKENDNRADKIMEANRTAHCRLVRNPHTGRWELKCD